MHVISSVLFDVCMGANTKKMLAVYREDTISMDEVLKIVRLYPDEYDARVVFMTPAQYETVFDGVLKPIANKEGSR